MSFFKRATYALAVASTSATGVLGKAAPVAPGQYIVEFAEGSAPAFYSNLSSSNIDATPHVTLDHQLFNGASFKLADSHDNDSTINTIQSMSMVNKIWPVRLYSNPATLISKVDGSNLASASLQKRAGYVDTYVPHVMGGVDKLHEEGFTGDGLFIGVVDTGVDYNHPALGGGFGPGHKVVTGYDLVGDAYDGTTNITPVPDNDPMDCGGHGTHVSGIIGADPNPFNFTGIAPNATLGMWKVFGCTGQVGNDILIAAFNMAYEAGVDLISSSIGGNSGWTEDPWDVAVQRIAEKGVPCIIAAGNDGANGLFDTSTAAESIGATSVGSIDSLTEPGLEIGATYLINGGNPTNFGYSKGKYGDFGTISVPMYAITLDPAVVGDGCSALPATTPDLSSYVVLIRRGQCTFDTKIANAQAFGAKRILFYNNIPGVPSAPGDSSLTFPVGMVANIQGAQWVSQLKSGMKVTVDFTAEKDAKSVFVSQADNLTGGKMSTFSSWGPSYEGWIKPQISAPGGNILSTLPLAQGGYGVESGTSMATPFISGCIALIKQVRGKSTLSPAQLTSVLATTAAPVDYNDGATTYSYLAPVVQQGGGLINAFTAAHTNSFVDLYNIALNDTVYFQAAHPVTILNTGSVAQKYSFANMIAATAYTLNSGAISPAAFGQISLAGDAASGAIIRFEPESLTVGPKSSAVVTLHFTRPTGLDESRIPVYSGFVAINGSAGDSLSLPYAGIATSMKTVSIMDTAGGYPYLTSSSDATQTPIIANGTVFVLPGNSTNFNSTTGLPSLAYALAMGSRTVRIDIQPANPRGLPRIVGQQVLGSVPGYPVQNHVRQTADGIAWNGQLADGSWAPAGKYRFMLRALKIFGDVTYDHDYEMYTTQLFEINYAT